MNSFQISTPAIFNFEECLIFLNRHPAESTHTVVGNKLRKLIRLENEPILFEIAAHPNGMVVQILNTTLTPPIQSFITDYIHDWFDLDTDLKEFYQRFSQDPIIKGLLQNHYGLRMVYMPNLFETLCWAVLGQQVNIGFAYSLKRRITEKYGTSLEYQDTDYHIFPSPDAMAQLEVKELHNMQLTQRKSEYIIGIAQLMTTGDLSRNKLKELKLEHVEQKLLKIRGIGHWTAHYIMMKNLKAPTAFPLADVGLHNAIRQQLGMDRKPTVEEIEEWKLEWNGWEAYIAFYLWRSLVHS